MFTAVGGKLWQENEGGLLISKVETNKNSEKRNEEEKENKINVLKMSEKQNEDVLREQH